MIATHKLNVSAERLNVARSWLAANAHQMASLPADARTLAALALLICDETGHVSEADLASAGTDSRAVSAANRLILSVGN